MKQVHEMGKGTLGSIVVAEGALVKVRLGRENTRRSSIA